MQWPPSFTLDVWITATPFWLSNGFHSSMAKADIQCMSERRQIRLLWSVKFKLSQNDFPIPQYVKIFPPFPLLIANLSRESIYDQNIHPSMLGAGSYPRFRSCPSVLGLLYIHLVIHFGGKLIRSVNRLRGILMGKKIYRPYVLSLTPNCHTTIVHVLLVGELKQAVSHFMGSYMLWQFH